MVLDNVYQFLMDKFGRIVIVRGETNSFEVVEPNDEKSGKIRLGRLFYANVVEGKIKGSDDDANKILTQGVVANRNGASASNCVEEIFRIMLIDDMKLEIRYLEDVITNSIIMGIICEDLQRIAPSRKDLDLFEEEKRDVLNNHREIFDYKYELYRKAFISYINGLNKDNDWNISDKLAFGEVINSSIVECLIGLQYNKKEQTGDRNGVKRATLEKLKKMKEDLERVKNYQNVGVNKDNLDEYYVRLWQKFHMESITRNGDGSIVVPLINVMVLPDIREDVRGKKLDKPFSRDARVQYVRANSGMGKSCMLRSIIIVCIVRYIYNNHMDLMSEVEIKAYKDNKFSAIEEFYFGETKKNRIPVYIEAAKFNEYGYNDKEDFSGEDLFSLSENYSELRTAFNTISDEFLFLIDSLDEIEEGKVSNFNQCIYNLVGQMCEKNQFIITSRFSGRSIHINEMQYLRLAGFDTETIHAYLEKCAFLERSEELKSYIDSNRYAYKLAQNPFMLTAMLDTKDFAVKNFLDKITDAIVNIRMDKKVLAMNEHEIKAVLSYLAFYISFCEEGEKVALEKIHISNIIKQARENGLISDSGHSINISDEQIDTFTNTISCQSGIITLINENGHIKFEFQDELVMCYLAAEFINNLSGMFEGDIPAEFYFNIENRDSAITHNVYEISRFWDNFRIDDNICSKRFCQIVNLIIQITKRKSYGIALIYYMLLRGFTTIEEEALANIKTFFIEYNENVYGDNIPFNRKNELMKVTALIDRLFSISR